MEARGMRILAVVLGLLLLAIQYPLWLGKGGWFRVRELDRQVNSQKETNAKLQARNQALDAEVKDLKQGMDAVEERARSDLGMVKEGEVFFQILKEAPPVAAPASSSAPAPGASGSATPGASNPAAEIGRAHV